jgi:hypothetical protein
MNTAHPFTEDNDLETTHKIFIQGEAELVNSVIGIP